MDPLQQLLYLRGVSAEYFNYSGERTVVPNEVRLQLLEAVGYDLADDEAIHKSVFELDAQTWKTWVRNFNILSVGETEYIEIRVHPDEKFQTFSWHIKTESSECLRGHVIPGNLPEVGEYYIDGVRYTAHQYALSNLPLGYHEIEVSSMQRQIVAVLAVVPARCFDIRGDGPSVEKRLLGINCQLYTLRSERNWGIGDFSDLNELIQLCAAEEMDLIGLNPLHAPHMTGADFASPYSPSDRRFLNPLYIDVQSVQEYDECAAVRKCCGSKTFKKKLAALRAEAMVDYDGVAAVKYWVLEGLFKYFLQHHLRINSDRAQAFRSFVQQRAEPLAAFAEHESRQEGSSLVPAAKDPQFHQYLQWLAHTQLRESQDIAKASGMKIGLMGDLAVGAVAGGSEVDGKPGLFCKNATVGAPPDPFSDEGQNWNLPALDPVALRSDNYRHYIDLLRANMSYCGALRIDHVMGLLRLWWCLPGTANGAYVYYPFEDLLAILRLESHRHQCLVIGEDMGVVPPELRARMSATAMYSNKVFYFEREPDQQFKQPENHQTDSLLMVTNHDVSPLAGWWNGTDLELRSRCGLVDTGDASLTQQREQEKHELLKWLQSLQLLPLDWACDIAELERPFDVALLEAVLAANARSHSLIVLFQLDDLQLIEEPVNIPGTYREYPNWRRKQRRETSALFQDTKIQALMGSMKRERQQ